MARKLVPVMIIMLLLMTSCNLSRTLDQGQQDPAAQGTSMMEIMTDLAPEPESPTSTEPPPTETAPPPATATATDPPPTATSTNKGCVLPWIAVRTGTRRNTWWA
mgnify:CR=1 FL=1